MHSSEQNDLIFALDIGTRSVIGVVGRSYDGLFHVEACEMREHPQRAMMDGQIEDIQAVSKIANEVKQALEKKLSVSLNSVCVAAAGRALRTTRAFYEAGIPGESSVTASFVAELEMNALNLAAEEIKESEDGAELLCVGHSVVKYSIDGYGYSNILDHKGKKARVDIIATFLPSPVVTSLEAAMQKISLSVESLTLEPIAAMNAVIPKELRLLNLALVDIGAGTSDIAICDEGTVAAYTMATIAGDEVTEAIIRNYLVDFETAERIKHEAAAAKPEIVYTDIMGFEYKQPLDSVIKAIGPALGQLTDTICEKIIEVNGKTPAAVFLVGGGSRTPLLCQLVAKRLGLDERKVALGGNNFMKKLAVCEAEIYGPEYATPLGIAFTAAESTNRRAFDIELNGEKRRLMRTGALSFIDVLLLCGYSYADIMGKSGRGVSYELNGQRRSARGGMMRPASLVLNGSAANISSNVVSGDVLHFAPAVNGADAAVRVRDILPENEIFEVMLNGMPKKAGVKVFANGEHCGYDYVIKDGDVLNTLNISTLGMLLETENYSAEGSTFFINGSICGQSRELISGDIITEMQSLKPVFDDEVYTQNDMPQNNEQNGETAVETAALDIGGESTIESEEAGSDNISAAVDSTEPQADEADSFGIISAEVNSEESAQYETDMQENADTEHTKAEYETDAAHEAHNGEVSDSTTQPGLHITINGHPVNLPQKPDGAPYLFLDMLEMVDIDPSKPQGDIVLMLNNKSASFLDTVAGGDNVDIYWKKR